MQVTEVRLQLVEGKGRMKAVASATMDREFVIHDIKVIEGDRNTFIAFPSRKNLDGQFVDICHPINQESRNKIQDAVLTKYEEVLNSSKNEE